jgi:microcystin-dependent protein
MGFEPFIGEIRMFGFNFAPRGWATCDGQLLQISQNSALFSLLGTTYGGDGVTNFALPDLRGRVPIHAGNGPGLTPRQLGQTGGTETVALNANQVGSHTHAATTIVTGHASSDEGTSATPTDSIPAKSGSGDPDFSDPANADTTLDTDAHTASTTISNAGGGQAHPNIQPFECVNFCIALVGVFPSRN